MKCCKEKQNVARGENGRAPFPPNDDTYFIVRNISMPLSMLAANNQAGKNL
jgi:hypothetical protein